MNEVKRQPLARKKMTIKVGIIGATGYAGIELVRLLQQHPEVEMTQLVTESYAGQAIAQVYPHLKKMITLTGTSLDITNMNAHCECVFLALPHGKAKEIAAPLLQAGKKVIDLSADFRLHDATATPQFPKAIYGLPEAGYRNAIRQAVLIANPGCYPTASILSALPALHAGIIDVHQCIFDAKSGISGAGRNLQLRNHYCEVTENLTPYQLAGQHHHTYEIEQELSAIAKHAMTVQFTPHLVPMIRGLLVTAYFKLKQSLSTEDVYTIYQDYYQKEFFIRISSINEIPQVKQVRGSNFCDIGVCVDKRTQRLIVVSVIDNLMKGAAGQAVQNFNLLYGLEEKTGLMNATIYP